MLARAIRRVIPDQPPIRGSTSTRWDSAQVRRPAFASHSSRTSRRSWIPSEQWIAYGVVVDDDGDGVPDRRFGVDNSQVAASGEDPQRRQWITDLHTGRTLLEDDFGETFFDTFYPPGAYGVDGARLSFGGDATGGGKIGGLPERFYAWAAVIENGRVVATDYAPDVGWLDPVPSRRSRVRQVPLLRSVPRPGSRTIPTSRAGGYGRSRSSTTVPNPRRSSWPRRRRRGSPGGWSGL